MQMGAVRPSRWVPPLSCREQSTVTVSLLSMPQRSSGVARFDLCGDGPWAAWRGLDPRLQALPAAGGRQLERARAAAELRRCNLHPRALPATPQGGPDPDTPGGSAGAAEGEQLDATMPYQEQYLGPGEEPLPPEDDFFFDSGAP